MTSDQQGPGRDTFDIRCADAVELVTEYLDGALNASDLAAFDRPPRALRRLHRPSLTRSGMTIQLTCATSGAGPEVMPPNLDELLSRLRDRATGAGPTA